MALSDSTIQIIWTRNFLEEQGFKMGPATAYHSKTQNGILPTILTEDLFVARISSAFLRSVILDTVQRCLLVDRFQKSSFVMRKKK